MENKSAVNNSEEETIAETESGTDVETVQPQATVNNSSVPYNINNLWIKTNANWYASIMQKYANATQDQDDIEENVQMVPEYYMNDLEQSTGSGSVVAIKGGRNDPCNPFSITSPSFSKSAAKAILTTEHSSKCTNVTVSIMSIGKPDKLVPKIVNSKAAKGGLISVLKQDDAKKNRIYKKVMKESNVLYQNLGQRFGEKPIERLDINVKIKNYQMIDKGLEKRWQCILCVKSYTTKHNLVTHILDHCGIRPHLCLQCGKYFRQLAHLNAHMLTHDKVRPHECHVCGKRFTQTGHLKRHMLVHSGRHACVCHVCCRGFATDNDLLAHMVKHETMMEQCSVCGEQFESHKLLMEHSVLMMHNQRIKCEKCRKEFGSSADLQIHSKESHGALRPWKCRQCGLSFLKVHQLKSHLFTHTGACPFVCMECGRSFNQKANLRRHMLIHRGERLFKCHICEKSFTQPQTLKTHMFVHAKTMPFQCKICFRKFSRHHNLKGHMHVHNNSRPFDCSLCECSFTLRGNLNRHMRMKHNVDTVEMEESANPGSSSDGANAADTLAGPESNDYHDVKNAADMLAGAEYKDYVKDDVSNDIGDTVKDEFKHSDIEIKTESEMQSPGPRSQRLRKKKQLDDMYVV